MLQKTLISGIKVILKSKVFFTITYVCVLFFPCLELCLRVGGGTAFEVKEFYVESNPKNAFVGNDSLGIGLNDGVYDITINKKLHFTATHNDGRRKVVAKKYGKPVIAFFGCSFTYGYGVNDSATFVNLLQEQFGQYTFENHGVIGYGTVQSYLQLNKRVQVSNVPQKIVLVYSDLHPDRNALSPLYRKSLKFGFSRTHEDRETSVMNRARFPYFENGELRFEPWNTMYDHWSGRTIFASVNFLQNLSDRFGFDETNKKNSSYSAISKINKICDENGIELLVVVLDNDDQIKSVLEELGIGPEKTCRVNIDFGDKALTNAPYDSHPNQKGHQYIASKIAPYL